MHTYNIGSDSFIEYMVFPSQKVCSNIKVMDSVVDPLIVVLRIDPYRSYYRIATKALPVPKHHGIQPKEHCYRPERNRGLRPVRHEHARQHGGVVGTLGNVTGAALRGVGNTLTGATGVESLLNNVAKGVEKAGKRESKSRNNKIKL
jgi:hypothetical protein